MVQTDPWYVDDVDASSEPGTTDTYVSKWTRASGTSSGCPSTSNFRFCCNFHHCNLPGHIPSSLRSLCSFSRLILVDPRSAPKTSSRISIFCFWVLPRGEELMHCVPERGRGESDCDWIMSWITLLHPLATTRSACFGFTSADIHVWLPCLRHPFRRYVLHCRYLRLHY